MDAVQVITPTRSGHALAELWGHRGLLWSLTLREIQVRYRQAWLGVAWAIVQPVALMAVTTLLFHRLLRVDTGEVPYALFAFTALVPWTFFHTAVTTAVPSLVNNASLVKKIWFPREAIPLAAVGAAVLDLLAGLLLWFVLLAVAGPGLTVHLLWTVPLVLILLAFATAVALFGAATNVHFRDVKHALPLLLQLLFFATPIVYPLTRVPEGWRPLFLLNPLTGVVEGMRAAAFEHRAPEATMTWIAAAVAFVLLGISYAFFLRAGRRFADVV
jgi:ABC-type polysaccharide/polyol phosphate export permease